MGETIGGHYIPVWNGQGAVQAVPDGESMAFARELGGQGSSDVPGRVGMTVPRAAV